MKEIAFDERILREREREREIFEKFCSLIRFASRRTDSREEFFFSRERERERKKTVSEKCQNANYKFYCVQILLFSRGMIDVFN